MSEFGHTILKPIFGRELVVFLKFSKDLSNHFNYFCESKSTVEV